jgi:hypothetical protein
MDSKYFFVPGDPMIRLGMIGNTMARVLLLPGDLACDALGLGHAENRDLVRMLVNSLVWTMAGIITVAFAV